VTRLSALLLVVVTACGGGGYKRPTWPDAAVELRDDSDRESAVDRLWTLPPGPDREAARAAIAKATADRIADAIEEDRTFVAAQLLDDLTALWSSDPTAIGKGLAPHAQLIEKLRAMFAKSGALEPALQSLVLLAEIEPDQRTARIAEIDEILGFADELAMADNGPDAKRAQPIELLGPTALALPLPWLVDRYVGLLVARQVEVSALISAHGASIQLVRAHHDILATQRRIAFVLARAGRSKDIFAVISPLRGLGADHRDLVLHAEMLANDPTAEAYDGLAGVLREQDEDKRGSVADRQAALAVCMAGLAKFPTDADLLAAAAGDARSLGRIEQAIGFAEAALRAQPDVDPTATLRLGKLYGERIARLAESGRPTAAHDAWRGVLAFTSKEARHRPHTVWQQAAAIAESALGKGLAGQGLVTEGTHALTNSIERAPSIEAYEALTAIDVHIDQFATARSWADSGIAMLSDQSAGDRYRRAKLERLEGDALLGAGRAQEAAQHYLEGMRQWATLGEDKQLPPFIAAERMLESARAMVRLGEGPGAVALASKAIDIAPDEREIVTGVVGFLVEADSYRDALDAYHRGLGSELRDVDKVYMSLWIAGEAKHRGEPLDRLADEYLASRQGNTWYELLARAATNRATLADLKAAATTMRRKAELAFYSATLGLDPLAATPDGQRVLLAQVIASQIVFAEEFELARRYLRR
jgi:tetratricopeptide (TPR) repeat protein